MVMSPDPGGILDVLVKLTRVRLGGPIAGGAQFVSWIHGLSFVRAVEFLMERPDISGPVNLAAPHPLPQRELMRSLRGALGVPLRLPATAWMAEIGAFVLRVVPGHPLEAGFVFEHPEWGSAVKKLVPRWREVRRG